MNLSDSLFLSLRSIGVSKIAILILGLLLPLWVQAQKSKTQLEKEKIENLRKIAEAEKILTETQSEKKVTVGQLQALNQQIKARTDPGSSPA